MMSKKLSYELDFTAKDSVSRVVSKISSEIDKMGSSTASVMGRVSVEFGRQAEGVSAFSKKNAEMFQGIKDSASDSMQGTASAYTRALEGMRASMADGTGNIREQIALQKKAIAELEKEYAKLQGKKNSAGTRGEQERLGARADAMFKDLQDEKQALDGMIQAQNEYRQSSMTVSLQIEKMRNQMAKLRLENKENTVEYENLRSKLEDLSTAHREILQEQKALSTGATQWGGMISGLQGLMGLYSSGSGIVSMFTADNEKLMAVQTKMQSVMAIMMGMQQASNTLHATSAFRIVTVRRVTELWKLAQDRLTVSLGVSTVAVQGLMAAVTLGASVIIGVGVSAISALIRKNKEQKEAQQQQAKAAEEANRNIRNSVASSIATQLMEYRKLQDQWKTLNGDLNAQKTFIEDNKTAFENLGVSVRSVDDAENLLIDNTPAFLQSLKNKAMAAAALELATEKYKSAIEKMLLAEQTRNTPNEDDRDRAYEVYNQKSASANGILNRGVVASQRVQIIRGAMLQFAGERADEYNKAAQEELKAGDAYFAIVKRHNEQANALLQGANISTSTGSGTNNEVSPVVGSIAHIEHQLESLREKLRLASAQERIVLQGDINMWQKKLDAINAELAVLSLPASVETLADLQSIIGYYEQSLLNASETERTEIQKTINAYKAKKESIETTLAGIGISSNPKTLDELEASLAYYQSLLGKAAPDDRMGIQQTINKLQTDIDSVNASLAAMDIPSDPKTLQDFERSIAALEDKLKTAGESERIEIQKTINAYRLKKKSIEDSLSLVEMQEMFPGVDMNNEIVISLHTRLEGAELAMQKIKELQSLSAVAQTDEEKEAIEGMIKQWSQYTGGLDKVSKKGEGAGQVLGSIGSIMGQLSGNVEGNASSWLSWGASLMQSISALIPQLVTLCTANTAVAATGAAASVASIPFVGWLMAGTAALGVVATLASIPRYAEGGIAYGPTLGLFGEYSGAATNPEVVAPLDKLKSIIGDEGADEVPQIEFRIRGGDLYALLSKYNRKRSRT